MKSNPANPPLHGITIIDFDSMLPGICTVSVLQEMGAQVLRIKNPLTCAQGAVKKHSYYFNQNERVEEFYLDLKSSDGKSKAMELIALSDILLEGFRPGKMAALGLDYSSIHKINKKIIYTSISGYGQTGPDALVAGHDINYMAAAGALALTTPHRNEGAEHSNRTAPASVSPIPFSDVGGAMYAVSSILAALYQREFSGVGQWLDISLAESLVHQMSVRLSAFQHKKITGITAQTKYLSKPAYGVFKCNDDQYVSIAALENKFFTALISALELRQFSDEQWRQSTRRADFADVINDAISAAVLGFSSDELIKTLRKFDVPAMLVVNPDDLTTSEQFACRKLFINCDAGYLPRFPVRLVGMKS